MFLRMSMVFVLVALLVCFFAVTANAAATDPNVCTGAKSPDGKHHAGLGATCTTDCKCLYCDYVFDTAFGHTPGDAATCGSDQICTTCAEVITPKLGFDACVGDIPAATCTERQQCVVCSRIMAKATGHHAEGTATCGQATKCKDCKTIVDNATGDHTFDWSKKETVRAASANLPELIKLPCTVCGGSYERAFIPTVGDAFASVPNLGAATDGGKMTTTIIKVADLADNKLAKKHVLLQAFSLALTKNDKPISMEGMTVTMKVNDGVLGAGKDNIELYEIAEDGSTAKVEISSFENGEITFKANNLSKYVIVDANEIGGNTGLVVALVVVAVVAAAAVAVCVVVVLRKKKTA